MKEGSIFYFVISIFAAMTSWFLNKSVLLVLFHYFIGPLYLLICLLRGTFADGGFMEIINWYF